MNILGYENLNEVFFDVFEIKANGLDLLKEKRGDFNGNPIIEMDLKIGDQIYKNVRFVLTKENKICINPNLLDHTKIVIQEKSEIKIKPPAPKKEFRRIIKPTIQENKKVTVDPIIKEESLIEKTKKEFFESIKGEVLEELKREVKAGIIADLIKENLQTNFDSVIHNNGNKNKLQRILENFNNSFRKEFIELAEKVSRREAMRYSESGGGTNAAQYANGGTMKGDLTVTGRIQSDTLEVSGITVDTLSVNSLSTNNEFIIHNLVVSEGISAKEINVDTLSVNILSTNSEFVVHNLTVSEGISANSINVDTLIVNTLSTNYEFVVHNLTVSEGITANNTFLYDSLNVTNNIYATYSEVADSNVSNTLFVGNSANISGLLSAYSISVQDLTVDSISSNTLTTNYAYINHDLTVAENLTANNGTITNDLVVLGNLSANSASIATNLNVIGGVSSTNGYVFGDVLITGNLRVNNEIFGDLVTGNTIVNSNGDTLLAKVVKNISGSSFINGNYTVHHNLDSYDLLLSLYYINLNGTREVVYASMINDSLSTTQISFGSQPPASDNYKLVIMS